MFKKFTKKSVYILIITVLLFGTGIVAVSAEVGTVIASSLNVRAEANTSSEVLCEVGSGSEVYILERVGDWYMVNVGDIGYVNAAYVRTAAEQATGELEEAVATEESKTRGQEAVDFARTLKGIPYVYGGTTTSGFDCSGFAQYVARHMGVSINRVAADQARNGVYVSKENLQPGDLVFFAKPGRAIHHVGIYTGNGNYIHSPQTGRVISEEPMTRSDYYTARRIF